MTCSPQCSSNSGAETRRGGEHGDEALARNLTGQVSGVGVRSRLIRERAWADVFTNSDKNALAMGKKEIDAKTTERGEDSIDALTPAKPLMPIWG